MQAWGEAGSSQASQQSMQVYGAGTKGRPGVGLLQLPLGSLALVQAQRSVSRPHACLPEHVCMMSLVPARHASLSHSGFLKERCVFGKLNAHEQSVLLALIWSPWHLESIKYHTNSMPDQTNTQAFVTAQGRFTPHLKQGAWDTSHCSI